MNFSDIKSMTFVENVVIVDGRDILISRTLDSNITAVQFHNGNNFCIEEPLMKEVPLSKYQFVLDEFEKARDILDTPKEKSLEDLKKEEKENAQKYLDQTDWVESYLIRHELNLEIIPEDSEKLVIKLKRDEAKALTK